MNEPKHKIKIYFQDYVKWFPERWTWELADEKSHELFMKHRARRCTSALVNNDKLPSFDSIEKDANQFGLVCVEFTDIFGIRWSGSKGVHAFAGDSDYDVHMYYYDPENMNDDDAPCVSDDVTADKIPEGYAQIFHRGVREFIDMEDIVDIDYRYVIENHLFKDSFVIVSYDGRIKASDNLWDIKDTNTISIWDIHGFAVALKTFKPALYEKFLAQVNEHFKKLQESDRDEERHLVPTDGDGKVIDAAEYFDLYAKCVNQA